MATRNESCSRASPMMKCRLLLVCLVYQLTLLLLRFRLFVGGVINLIVPVWIRQRHGCDPALLELQSSSRLLGICARGDVMGKGSCIPNVLGNFSVFALPIQPSSTPERDWSPYSPLFRTQLFWPKPSLARTGYVTRRTLLV